MILAPSIAIREQWIERFTNGFLENKEDKDLWISNDLKIQRPIICITYQAFYSAYKKEISNEGDDEEDSIDGLSESLAEAVTEAIKKSGVNIPDELIPEDE